MVMPRAFGWLIEFSMIVLCGMPCRQSRPYRRAASAKATLCSRAKVLAFPEAGSVLKWVATIPISAPGQEFSWDQHTPNVIYTLSKQASEVIVGQVMNSKLPSEVPLQR